MENVIQLSEERLTNILQSAAYMGAVAALRDAGVPIKEFFSKASMYKKHGRKRVDKLISSGKLTPRNIDGSKNKVYSEQEFQSLIQ